jgi:hypothetical protein
LQYYIDGDEMDAVPVNENFNVMFTCFREAGCIKPESY